MVCQDSFILLNRYVEVLTLNFPAKTIESIHVIFLTKGNTWTLDVVNRAKIASVFCMASGLRLQHIFSEET